MGRMIISKLPLAGADLRLFLRLAMPKPSPKKPDIEFAPDAWSRFERLVKSAAKIGHMPHDQSAPQAKAVKQRRGAKTKVKKHS
jgi:hypothetical protein